jgi:hypothetical protein
MLGLKNCNLNKLKLPFFKLIMQKVCCEQFLFEKVCCKQLFLENSRCWQFLNNFFPYLFFSSPKTQLSSNLFRFYQKTTNLSKNSQLTQKHLLSPQKNFNPINNCLGSFDRICQLHTVF